MRQVQGAHFHQGLPKIVAAISCPILDITKIFHRVGNVEYRRKKKDVLSSNASLSGAMM